LPKQLIIHFVVARFLSDVILINILTIFQLVRFWQIKILIIVLIN
jgi:hypothetical protein